MDLSIIIVNWNSRDLLVQCLESVVRYQMPDIKRLLHLDALGPHACYPMDGRNWDIPRKVNVVHGARVALHQETPDQVGLPDEEGER